MMTEAKEAPMFVDPEAVDGRCATCGGLTMLCEHEETELQKQARIVATHAGWMLKGLGDSIAWTEQERRLARTALTGKPDATAPAPKRTKRARPKSRTQRWADACAEVRALVEAAEAAMHAAQEGFSALQDIQSEYQDWYDNLPEGLQSSGVGEKLEAITQLELSPDEDDLGAMRDAIEEAENIDLPMGFGRD